MAKLLSGSITVTRGKDGVIDDVVIGGSFEVGATLDDSSQMTVTQGKALTLTATQKSQVLAILKANDK